MNVHRRFTAVSIALAVSLLANSQAAPPARVLIVVGPSTHPPGSHEVAAGGRLMKHCVEHMTNLPNVSADVFLEWPHDPAVRDAASTIVFIGDQFPPARLPDAEKISPNSAR